MWNVKTPTWLLFVSNCLLNNEVIILIISEQIVLVYSSVFTIPVEGLCGKTDASVVSVASSVDYKGHNAVGMQLDLGH